MKIFIASFILAFSCISSAQFLLVKGSGNTTFPSGKGPYGTLDGITVTNGTVLVTNGSTLNLNAGSVYDFKSLTVVLGGKITISGHGIVEIGSVGNIVIDGSIVSSVSTADYTTCLKSFNITEPDTLTIYTSGYEFLSMPLTAGSGGAGGIADVRIYANKVNGAPGGLSGCGIGGGGGAGAAMDSSDVCGSSCPTGGLTAPGDGQSGSASVNSLANGSNSTLGVGGNASVYTGGVGGGTYGGTSVVKTSPSRAGGGGGGGFRGGSASSLVLKTRSAISGAGSIDLRGQSGKAGGNGGAGTATDANYGVGGGGGGGGGTGGFGGNIWIYYQSGTAFPASQILLSGGSGGTGGTGGGKATGSAVRSTNGNNGNTGENGGNGSVQANQNW
jgi:hypothetical protein